jgi:hypothetical protein
MELFRGNGLDSALQRATSVQTCCSAQHISAKRKYFVLSCSIQDKLLFNTIYFWDKQTKWSILKSYIRWRVYEYYSYYKPPRIAKIQRINRYGNEPTSVAFVFVAKEKDVCRPY